MLLPSPLLIQGGGRVQFGVVEHEMRFVVLDVAVWQQPYVVCATSSCTCCATRVVDHRVWLLFGGATKAVAEARTPWPLRVAPRTIDEAACVTR